MGKADDPSTTAAEGPASHVPPRSHFTPEERNAIRESLLGIARQRGVNLSEVELHDRVENALLAYEDLAGQMAMGNARWETRQKVRSWAERRHELEGLKAYIQNTFHSNIPNEVLAMLKMLEAHIESIQTMIDENSHRKDTFRYIVCGEIMNVWVDAGGKLSASSTEEQGSYGPLIEHLELMFNLFKVPIS